MTTVGINNSSSYASIFSSSATSNWIADTMTAIKNQQNQGGLLGMLNDARGDNSLSSFLGKSANFSNSLATISQTSITNAGSLIAQIASSKAQEAKAKKLQEALADLNRTQHMVQKKNTLDPIIYFPDGSRIDTNANIMTMVDGTQYDTTTGLKYVDQSSIMQLANGGTLNTKTNIMTMPDGTQIDTVTGLKV